MIQNLVATLFLVTGVIFLAIAAIGFVRLPDVFSRLHVTGVIDTLGAPLVMLGAAVYLGPQLAAGKLLLGIVFIAITSPLLGHLLARAALEAEHEPAGTADPKPLKEWNQRRRARQRGGREP